MYVAVTGEEAIDIRMSDMIMLTFDLVMTESEFFADDMSEKLAIFFNVDKSKVSFEVGNICFIKDSTLYYCSYISYSSSYVFENWLLYF